MGRTLAALALTLVVACGGGSGDDADAVLDDYRAQLDALVAATDDYVAGVGTAADVGAVTDLQTTYEETADGAVDALDLVLGDIEGCEHMGDGMDRVLDARLTLFDAHEAIHDLLNAHAAHTDVAECQAAATTHDEAMDAATDALAGHLDAWSGMTCGMMDGQHMN